MKRIYTICGMTLLLAGSLLATGCHAPSLSALKPAKEKLAVAIVGTKDLISSKEISDYTSKVFNESAVVFDMVSVEDDAKAKKALTDLASDKNIDLIVVDAKYNQYVTELAQTHDNKKFGVVGNIPASDRKTIRSVNVNREYQSFVAGLMMAGTAPKLPVGVIVKSRPSSESPEWKGLLEGIHYAGSSAAPIVITLEEAMSANGLSRIKSMPGRFYVLLDPVTADQMARLHESGKWLFSMHELPKMYPSVIARPRPIFTEGVQEEVQALLNNSWQENVSASVMGSTFFDFTRPDAFATGLLEQKTQVEEGLRKQTIKPDNYTKPPKEEKKDAQTN